MELKNWSTEWGGRTLSVEVGRMSKFANGSCVVRYGDTVISATAVMSKNTRDGIDFFPLSVEFEEKMYAAGKIKGSRFIKREGRPSDDAILTGRLVDRSIRPLFNSDIRNDVQVILTALSIDGENDPQICALIAASVVLSISNIPWAGPLAGARVGRLEGEWALNPSYLKKDESDLDIVVAGTPEKLIMVEADSKDVPDEDILGAMQFGLAQTKEVIDFIKKIQSEIGKEKFDPFADLSETDSEIKRLEKEVDKMIGEKVNDWMFDTAKVGKAERMAMVDRFKEMIKEYLIKNEVDEKVQTVILSRIKVYVEKYVTLGILEQDKRLDGRALNEVRELNCDIDLLPRPHGSALFSRGDTQVLSILTLGSPGDAQIIDTMEEDSTKKYMHHYNDNPATYGETGFLRGPGRRAIGHGALAEKALLPVLPDEADFPYVIRMVSEVLSSNGSSSMASTCASTLSLMAGGVPIKKPVAGIAIGLASVDDKWKVLTDLQDIEDGPGGMDFKITGTADGITAIQMDTKTHGLTWDIVKQAFVQSKEARLQILQKIKEAIAEPRAELSPYAPRIEIIHINPEKIGAVIGSQGKVIKKIVEETGAQIDIEDDGSIFVTSSDVEGMAKAKKWIEDLTHEIEAGELFDGKVVRLDDFGAFVELLPGKDGLVHVSEIAWDRTDKPGDKLSLGDIVKVKVKEVDNLGRVNLTIKGLLPKPEGYVDRAPAPRSGGHGGHDRKPGFFKKK